MPSCCRGLYEGNCLGYVLTSDNLVGWGLREQAQYNQLDATMEARLDAMSDEALEEELRLLAAATERKRQLIANAKESLKVLEDLKDEAERVHQPQTLTRMPSSHLLRRHRTTIHALTALLKKGLSFTQLTPYSYSEPYSELQLQ